MFEKKTVNVSFVKLEEKKRGVNGNEDMDAENVEHIFPVKNFVKLTQFYDNSRYCYCSTVVYPDSTSKIYIQNTAVIYPQMSFYPLQLQVYYSCSCTRTGHLRVNYSCILNVYFTCAVRGNFNPERG
jgi:hypothetical protein